MWDNGCDSAQSIKCLQISHLKYIFPRNFQNSSNQCFLNFVQQTTPTKMKEYSSRFVLYFKIIFSIIETCLQMILLDLKAPINTHMVSCCLKAAMKIWSSKCNINWTPPSHYVRHFQSLFQLILKRTLWDIFYLLFINEVTEVHNDQEIAQGKTCVCVTEEKKHQDVQGQGEIWNIVI